MPVRSAVIVLVFALLPLGWTQQRPSATNSRRVDAAAEARRSFFVESDLDKTLRLTQSGLKGRSRDPELLFLRMEAAALEADDTTVLDSALRLCTVLQASADPRGIIAASRIQHLAGNSVQFRPVIPAIRQMIANGSPYSSYLNSALIAAASEGAPGLKLLPLSHDSGLLTDWRIAGPFGKYSNIAFENQWPPERDELEGQRSGDKAVERFRFPNGDFDLPTYFSRTGVFYAVTTIKSAESSHRALRVESDGTLEVFVDGKSVLRKDDRFREGPDVVQADLKLTAGAHQLLVKFLPSALPLCVALVPVRSSPEQKLVGDPVELAYITAARNFWMGNYTDAAAELQVLHNAHPSAAVDFLLAKNWEHAADDSPEETNYLLSALKFSPQVAAAEYRLARKAYSSGRTDEAWQRVNTILPTHPDFAAAQALAAKIAIARDWTVEAIAATDAVVRIHPTCASLEDAYRFYSDHAQFERARQILDQIATCAPYSTQYVSLLSEAGEHGKALRAAAKLVLADPFSREARYAEVRELVLAGKDSEAREAAQELAKLAPNSELYQKLASSKSDLLALLNHSGTIRRGFTDADPFYAPYRRDGLAVVRQNEDKNPSLPAITLLEDKVSRMNSDSTVSVYFHRIVKVLTRSGIESYGEVSIPHGTDLLELRTIRKDGTTAEPEFHENKTTISMPALSPGDAIEEEYVVNYDDQNGITGHASEFTFTFGGYRMPVTSMRFVAITPSSELVATQELNGAPRATVATKVGERIQMWEQSNVPQYSEEPAVPSRELLPTVKVFATPPNEWAGIRDYYRQMLIDATQVGTRAEATLNSLRVQGSDFDKLKAIYTYVVTRIRDDESSFYAANVTSAEDTLATEVGSRTATFIALLRAAGMPADMVLTREISNNLPVVSNSAFTHPLVQVNLRGSTMTLDVESDYMGLGKISAKLDRTQALLVPTFFPAFNNPLIVLNSAQSEESVAEGTLRISPQGKLDARATIHLGASRAAQMRSTLSGIDAGGRQQFLQDLASRIFNGATDTTGEIINERELELPLEVSFHCQVAKFVNVSSAQIDVDQFVPNLGLRQMYAKQDTRHFPLFLDTPLVEKTTFRIDLPPSIRLAHRVNSVDIPSSFGHYRIISRELTASSFELTREFNIPVQVIAPAEYEKFRTFATRIADAERQKFAFAVSNVATTSNSLSK